MEPTDTLKGLVLESIEALEKVHPRLTSCRVMIEQATRGIPHARLDIGIPGGELVVNREPPMDPAHRDVTQAVREAFEVARRQLREHRKRRSPDGKRRELLLPHGRIVRLVLDAPGDRYGFLLAGDGRNIHFHENAVRGTSYEALDEGMEVRYVEAGGKEGPQASMVAPLPASDLLAGPERRSRCVSAPRSPDASPPRRRHSRDDLTRPGDRL